MKPISKNAIYHIKFTLNRLSLINDFELTFLTSLTKSKYIEVRLSAKQYAIFKNLNERFNDLDLFERYTDWFCLQGISLDDFEKAYLETYKGEKVKTQAFQNFIKQTLNKPKGA